MTASAHGLSDAAAVTAAGGGPPSSTTASFIGALHPSDDCLNRALRLWALVSPKATKRLVRLLTDGDRAACSRVCKTWYALLMALLHLPLFTSSSRCMAASILASVTCTSFLFSFLVLGPLWLLQRQQQQQGQQQESQSTYCGSYVSAVRCRRKALLSPPLLSAAFGRRGFPVAFRGYFYRCSLVEEMQHETYADYLVSCCCFSSCCCGSCFCWNS